MRLVAAIVMCAAIASADLEYEGGRYRNPGTAGRQSWETHPARLASNCLMWITAEFDALPPSGANTNYCASRWTNDTSGALITTSPAWTNATLFGDGVDDVHTARDNMNGFTNALTVCFWARPLKASGTAVAKWTGGGTQRSWMAYFTPSAEWQFFVSANGVANVSDTSVAVGTNVWAHVACVYVPSTSITIYTNGVVSGTPTTTSVPAYLWTAPTDDVKIFGTAGGYLRGYLDDIRVYSVAATSNEVYQIWERTQNPRVARP